MSNDPVGVQWAIGRANELYMAGKINADGVEEMARHLLEMRDRIDGASPPPLQSQPRQGNGGQKTGFASQKQERWLRDLLSKAGVTADDVNVVCAYLSATSHGGRGGKISSAIDDLRGASAGGEAIALVGAAEKWQETATATPGDTSGLPEVAA